MNLWSAWSIQQDPVLKTKAKQKQTSVFKVNKVGQNAEFVLLLCQNILSDCLIQYDFIEFR